MLKSRLVGNAMQMAVVQLDAGQTVYCEAGKFLWKTTNVGMQTRLGGPAADTGAGGGAGGLLNKALSTAIDVGKRRLAGESLAFQYFTPSGGAGLVAFAGVLPGEMRQLELQSGRGWLAEKDAFVAAEDSVRFDIAFTGWRSGRKGGEGFVLERFTGSGSVLIAGAGNFIELNPAQYGGRIQVDTGCVVAFQEGVEYGVERVGALSAQGLMTAMFGGEGLSLATLSGDGTVILQSMTMTGLARAIVRAAGLSTEQGTTSSIAGLLGGGGD